MRRHSPLRIQRLAREEEAALARLGHSREKLEAAQSLKKKHILRQMDEVEETFDYLSGLKSPGPRHPLPQLSRVNLLEELTPHNHSTASRKDPASSLHLHSLVSLDHPPSSSSRLAGTNSPKLDVADASARFTHLIKSCYQNQLSFIRSPGKAPKSPRRPGVVGPQPGPGDEQHFEEERDKTVLETLLTRGYGAQKIDPCNNKYAKKQNKFVSYRRYRENYLAVKGDILTVLESDEK